MTRLKTIGLTEQQKRFCAEYVTDYNAKAAAIRAGYAPGNAAHIGGRILRKAEAKAQIKQLQDQIMLELKINAKTLVEELARLAYVDMADYVDDNNQLVKIKNLQSGKSSAIQSLRVIEIKREQSTTTITEFKLHNKAAAIEKLGRHLGIFTPSENSVGGYLIIAPGDDIVRDGVVNEEFQQSENKDVVKDSQ